MRVNASQDPRRRHERHPADGMTCQIGAVCDLCASGMRVQCKGKPPLAVGQSSQFTLRFADGALALSGQAMWKRKVGRKTFELGIRFTNLKPAHVKALDSLARFGFLGAEGAKASGAQERSASRGARGRGSITACVKVPDYYGLLGIPVEATPDQVKRAFHLLAKSCHPDVTDDPNAAQKFAAISSAYEIISDPESRAMYDLRRAA